MDFGTNFLPRPEESLKSCWFVAFYYFRSFVVVHASLRRGFEFACNRVAMAAEGTTPLAPPQGEAAHGTEGAPSESLAAPQGLIPRREVTFDSSLLREQKACTETGAAPFDRESLEEFECREVPTQGLPRPLLAPDLSAPSPLAV